MLAALALGGCAGLPDAGPVVDAHAKGEANDDIGPYSNPRGPEPGDSPGDIVQGFLDAMTATPIQTQAARQFLTKAGQAAWSPSHVVTYVDASTPVGTSVVSVRLYRADQIDSRGAWHGSVPKGHGRIELPMEPQNGEWRISTAPNALVVPQAWFAQHYEQVSLYYFDPTARILVPQPVYLPRGDQLVSSLVQGLVRGPGRALDGVARSFVPAGLRAGLSGVAKGVADIQLKGGPGQPSAQATRLMLTQLAWTLREAGTVRSFRVTIGDRQVTDAHGSSLFPVAGYEQSDPAVYGNSGLIYALRKGLLVSGPAQAPTKVEGPFGATPQGIGAFAISLDSTRVAGTRGNSLLVGPVLGTGKVHDVVEGAGPLLRPSWDFAGRLWEVATAGGATVVYVDGTHRHEVRVPGISGQRITAFLVSRDGSRFVAVEHGAHADRLLVSRIRYDGTGRAVGATPAVRLPWQGGGNLRIRDIGWVSPTTIAVLHLLTRARAEVRDISVDGSTSALGATATTLSGRARYLATSPVGTQRSYAVTSDRLLDLSDNPVPAVPSSGLGHVTSAG
ncbi:MAG: LpqB family beta-propeller domain-containing protein [Nocardioides sp.]